jgi:hypothetical protein
MITKHAHLLAAVQMVRAAYVRGGMLVSIDIERGHTDVELVTVKFTRSPKPDKTAYEDLDAWLVRVNAPWRRPSKAARRAASRFGWGDYFRYDLNYPEVGVYL